MIQLDGGWLHGSGSMNSGDISGSYDSALAILDGLAQPLLDPFVEGLKVCMLRYTSSGCSVPAVHLSNLRKPKISLSSDSGQQQADVPQEPFVQAVRDYQAKMQSTVTLAAASGLAGGIAAGIALGFLIGRFAGSSGGGNHNGNGTK